ncbi:glycine betaine ABC transporter substrate-binding protein [Serinicoccus kebangsaanensis]|uniref:glycine betaine ABC transporter substrate-binding protein n=1 Tax=Serinicoccus kebangsaanensis TaxID=2602069 RepID=UPI00124F4B21|nr:glycine betaine ABC transporter substrate-binding protein [Serinicoccus kebangsaanensis]
MARRTHTSALALALAAGLTLAACGSDSGGDTDAGGDAGGSEGGGASGTITLGFIPSWTDGLSTAYLLEDQLTKLGYEVEMEELTEAALLYTGLANGDVDMYPSAWPEVTHADYMEEYGEDIEDLGAYYDNAKLTFAVPTYTEIESIADLTGNADMFGGQIIGIEPGAGLTAATQDSVMPTYELDGDYELVTSSTSAMLTELEGAIADQEDIVVTLWQPFWANSAFDVKTLEDPEGALGEAEALHFLGTAGFSEEFPEAAELIAGIQLDDEQYGALEDMVVNEYGEGQEAEAIDAFLEEYPDAFDTIVTEES